MKDRLRALVQEMIAARWADLYALADVLEHEYGFSLIFLNKKTNNRFSPTLVPRGMIVRALNHASSPERVRLEKEIETALVKEGISG